MLLSAHCKGLLIQGSQNSLILDDLEARPSRGGYFNCGVPISSSLRTFELSNKNDEALELGPHVRGCHQGAGQWRPRVHYVGRTRKQLVVLGNIE